MKQIKHLLVLGFSLSLLPLAAEDISSENPFSPATEEAAPLLSLEEELSLFDDEFDVFNEDLSFLDEAPSAAPQETAPVLSAQVEEVEVQSPSLLVLETPAVENEELLPREALISSNEELSFVDFTSIEAIEQQAMERNSDHASITTSSVVDENPAATLSIQGTALIGEPTLHPESIRVDLKQAFAGSPVIYSLLIGMSVIGFGIWLFALASLRSTTQITDAQLRNLHNKLGSNQFEEALTLCQQQPNLFSKMIASGIQTRRHGLAIMVETMKSEGKRASVGFWQKIGLLNDIAIIAPMLGLLGTVLGMFYAFYDVNRSIESISSLFDGLGVSVGTTVAGLVVAILALILQSTAKYRLVKALAQLENEAQSMATLIEDRTSIYNKG